MFIRDFLCISPQKTYNLEFGEQEIVHHIGTRYAAAEPIYSDFVPAALLRRMGKSVRMGVGAGLPLLRRYDDIQGIILATGNGGLEDCLKFLNQIVQYKEGSLTPTNFVQSTPNAVAGNLALLGKNIGYNITHVHDGLAFEAAVLDAKMQFEENKTGAMLLGAVDEISDYNFNINLLAGAFKIEDTNSETLLSSNTPGTVCGEGAVMFVVEALRSENSMAEIVDVTQASNISEDDLYERLDYFLSGNNVHVSDIHSLVLGYSGDSRSDYYYSNLRERFFPTSTVYYYKNLVGDYPTVSAFGCWLGMQIFSRKVVPDPFFISPAQNAAGDYILIYNHFQGKRHGFILLRKPYF